MPPQDPDRQQPPPGAGRARDLVRTRTTRARLPDTGRRHHIGAAPAELTVLGADGTVRRTRTTPGQLADKTAPQLAGLLSTLRAEMTAAAGRLDFEEAAALRDEVALVEAEIAGR